MSRFATLACAALLATASHAATIDIYFTALPATFQDGSYNGYATAIVNGIPNQLLICDDYYGETYMPSPSTMVYDYSSLAGSNPLQYAMWSPTSPASTASIQKYDEAADLLYGLSQLGPSASATAITDYQYALWNLMDPTAPYASGRSAQEQSLQAAALADVINPAKQTFLSDVVYPGLEIYTPTAAFAGNQEFLAFTPANVPEPGTLSLIGGIFFGSLAGLLVSPGARAKARAAAEAKPEPAATPSESPSES